jgi:hypothetical protein
MTLRRSLWCFLVRLGVSEALWWGFATLVVPPIITRAYHGQSITAINSFFIEHSDPLTFYLQQWQTIAWLGSAFWFFLWVLALLLATPTFMQRCVGEATPGTLGAIRLLTCSILLISTLWEDLASSAALPRALRRPMGLLEVLYALPIGFEQFVASASALTIFQWITALVLLLGAMGWRSRLTVPLGAGCYLLLGGLLRQYAWFYHTGLVPAYVLVWLSFTPCGDGWSYDRLRALRRGQAVPASDRPTAMYGWARYGCWVVIALPYVAAGLSKLRNGGLYWWDATNFRHILYRSTLSPMQFDFEVALALTRVPDVFVAVLALGSLLGEVLYGLVLVSRYARVILPALMVAMHLGILLLQNILFFDLILLQLAFVDWPKALHHLHGWLIRQGFMPAGLQCWIQRQTVLPLSLGAQAPIPPTGAGSARQGPAAHAYYRRRLLTMMAVLMLCWLCRLEFYPFTGMQMFSSYNTSGVILYDKVLAHYASGAIARAPIEQCLGAMADSRYRRVLAMTWDERQQQVSQEFFQMCGARWNQRAAAGERIIQFEVQRWQWDFQAQPQHATYGEVLSRRLYAVP